MIGLAELLSPHYTVIDYDRRGCGDSDEAGPFTVQREVEDIAALIDGPAAAHRCSASPPAARLRSGQQVPGLALSGSQSTRLPLWSTVPTADRPRSTGGGSTIWSPRGDRSGAIKHFMRNAMGMPAPIVAAMRLTPMWKDMAANAHTLPYDWAALGEHNMKGDPLRPAEWASVTVPARLGDRIVLVAFQCNRARPRPLRSSSS
jgi:hypothetical protein